MLESGDWNGWSGGADVATQTLFGTVSSDGLCRAGRIIDRDESIVGQVNLEGERLGENDLVAIDRELLKGANDRITMNLLARKCGRRLKKMIEAT